MWADLAAQRRLERSLALVRLGAVPFVASQVLIGWIANGFTIWPWLITAVMAVGSIVLYVLSRAEHDARDQRALAIAALSFDTAIFSAFALASSYEVSAPTRSGLILPVAEAALRFAVAGALIVTAATVPVLVASEYLRVTYTASGSFRWDAIVFQLALEAALGLLVGWLVGPRTIGMLGIMRTQPSSFRDEEIELASLLGGLVATRKRVAAGQRHRRRPGCALRRRARHLREVRAGQRVAHEARDGSRPVHLALDRRGARRHAGARSAAVAWRAVRARAADRR